MFRKIVLSAALSAALAAAGVEKEVEVYANSVAQNKNSATISGGVIVVYNGDVMSADGGVYDIKKKIITLKGNVIIIGKNGKRVSAKTLKVNLDNNKVAFKDFFEIDDKKIWIAAKKANKLDNNITLKNALFSSCAVGNPDWMIGFSKALYDTKSEKLKLDDAKIYIKDIPVFYVPYLPLFLSKKRRSGLLFPRFIYDNNDGFVYSQPIFWAISKSQDLEFDLLTRSNRGYGIFATYRIADTKYSFGKIRIGYFKDKSSYTNKYKLNYKEHYGAELYYKNNSLIDTLSKNGYVNKLYISGIYMSDLDYLNLQVNDKFYHHTEGSFYESRLNYFIKNNYFYTGIGLKYFKDVTKRSNKNTLQILPKLHFHIPYTNIIYNNLSYMVDATLTNYTRENGTKAFKAKIKVPLEAHFSLFSGYLNLNIGEELEATGYDFYNVPLNQKKYSSVVLNHSIELSSELSKIYKSGVHTMFFSATYTKTSILSEKWMKYKEIPKELKVDFVDDIPFESKITFRTHQYWHSFHNRLNINYILEAHYYPKEGRTRDLSQELNLRYKNWSFYSKLDYSFLHSKATEVYHRIGYTNGIYGLYLGYLWKRDILSFETTTKELNFNGYYNYKANLKFRANVAYNLKDRNLKNWEIGTFLDRHCWNIDFAFGQNIRPVIKRGGARGSISNNYFKVQFKVLPFGG